MVESDSSLNKASSAVASRRSHRKSRNGCQVCKKRHLKCDEMKPQCLNCANHSVKCFYVLPTNNSKKADAASREAARQNHLAARGSTVQFVESEYQNAFSVPSVKPELTRKMKKPVAALGSPSIDPIYCLEDFELQHYFLSYTCFTLMEDKESLRFWQSQVPRVGYKNPLVHHLMLALTCFHMSRSDEHDQSHCISRVDYHYGTGLRYLSTCLQNMTAQNSEAIWIGSVLVCFISMARGPQEMNFLFFGGDSPVEWIRLLQGVNVISTMIQRGRTNVPEPPDEDRSSASRRKTLAYREGMSRIRRLVEKKAAADPLIDTYRLAAKGLLQAFDSAFYDDTYAKHDESSRRPEPFGFVLFMWVSTVEQGFWDALQRKEALPLIILAHFGVLMHHMSNAWFSQRWPEHILRGICMFLPKEDRELIQWPLDQIQISIL
ncbi:unnamed protein product [Penicillium salamii]|uniref:Zn(2)-C6 fungal-type domain-containing protein n=1 Tax=Penicillium salamii TaxID=1612424 RepID=A0A9W4JCU2_9EURO|nr:unnamed protein product [Penicillium salamii]CAG7988068.1 unnamed protein product [Penicillium salamii]CAG8276230.1 unnamed protein product [Penicillium salamii]CAG8356765.1 unnamed protein product [Penicillium salamii]CAG8382971.1 unnamed protein product [Penicillium salamii]